ncbi:TolC family protein [candidate division KSB1 bacterium]|nr:TolC family protein [candidate division KSB1 bacterium]NIR69812.1 TolC family protein [candidate division KSB1 bacterium]NIS25802.1 TolC family protein [candidate division KSB1 bacterium]NIT72676.1 TolC family protein [candidate division KSB1 bacterium]NIU26491.1 TolC family protein [candidate division KSB1 bacterium]
MKSQVISISKPGFSLVNFGIQIWFGLLLFMRPVSLLAQNHENLSLEQAIEIGLRNNYSIIISRNEADIAENNNSLGNAGFLPTLDATASTNRTKFIQTRQEFANGQTNENDGATANSRAAGVALNWTIFDGLKMFTSRSQFETLSDIGELNSRIAVETNVARITNAYHNIVQQQELLKALQDAILISEERTRIAEAQYQIGSGSRLEWNRAKVDLIADSSAYLRQETEWSNAKKELNRLLARDVNTEFVIADTILINPNLIYEELRGMTLEQNHTLGVARKNTRLARLNLKEVRSEWYPTISFNAGTDFSRRESDAGFFILGRDLTYDVNLSFSFNLFDGFNTRRKSQNAQLDIRNSELRYEDIESQVEAELAKTYKRYQTSLQVVKLEEENVQLARQNVDIALQQFRLGTITSVDLREVQNNFVDSETRFTVAQLEAKLAETGLLRLSGQLVR